MPAVSGQVNRLPVLGLTSIRLQFRALVCSSSPPGCLLSYSGWLWSLGLKQFSCLSLTCTWHDKVPCKPGLSSDFRSGCLVTWSRNWLISNSSLVPPPHRADEPGPHWSLYPTQTDNSDQEALSSRPRRVSNGVVLQKRTSVRRVDQQEKSRFYKTLNFWSRCSGNTLLFNSSSVQLVHRLSS